MTRRRPVLSALLATAMLLLTAVAGAHPAGFTSINRYIGVEVDQDGRFHAAYLLDFAEFPAYAEIDDLDADHDGTVTPAEQRAYLDRRVPPIVGQWTIEIDGARVAAHVAESSLEVLPGERGLSTLRIAADVVIDAPPSGADVQDHQVRIRDRAFADHPGWRELVAEDSASAAVLSGPKGRASEALLYSNPGAGGPPRDDDASFRFRLRRDPSSRGVAPRPSPPMAIDAGLARLSTLIKQASGSFSFTAFAIALAFALGAAHALSPGHGKAMAAAYLVGGRARPIHAVLFGLTVTVAHTAVVYVVGCMAVTLERTIGSDRVLRDLEIASAITIVSLGIFQLSRRWREATGELAPHDHAHRMPERGADGSRSLVALGASSGVTPCPSALAVLLTAIAIHRYGFGLVLVLAFSFGVALTLSVTGLLVVKAKRVIERMSGAGRILRWLPVMSSTCVLLIGVLLCASLWGS